MENGRDLPDDFWAAKKKTKPFKEEITYLGIGLGFLFMGYMSGEFVFTGVAIIFLIMGLGGLLVYGTIGGPLRIWSISIRCASGVFCSILRVEIPIWPMTLRKILF